MFTHAHKFAHIFNLTSIHQVGTMTANEAVTDVQDAINAGFDAFALNVASTDDWSTTAISYLFSAANNNAGSDFKLFFSFDMTRFSNPSQFLPLLEQYASNDSYLLQNGQPFVSTFGGGASSYTFGQDNANDGWDVAFRQPLQSKGIDPFFVPNFDDWTGYPSGFFDAFSVVDGVFSWEAAWPEVNAGMVNESDSIDQAALQGAQAANKVYMMRKWIHFIARKGQSGSGLTFRNKLSPPSSSNISAGKNKTGTALEN
jgi:glucan endo-1,3-alpha-glucosidase